MAKKMDKGREKQFYVEEKVNGPYGVVCHGVQ
jgi:hypothetical protein